MDTLDTGQGCGPVGRVEARSREKPFRTDKAHVFIHSLNMHLLSTHCLLGMILSAGSTAVTKMDKTCLHGADVHWNNWNENLLQQRLLRFSVVSFHNSSNNGGLAHH